jgi:hypothetical protein
MTLNQAAALQILVEMFETVVEISFGPFKKLLPAIRMPYRPQPADCVQVGLEVGEVVSGLQVLERNGKPRVVTTRV